MTSEPPTPEQPAASVSYPCPDCGQSTDSLKHYGFARWCVIFLAVVLFQSEKHIACPLCTRKLVWRRMLFIIPVNVLLSIVLLMVVKADINPLNIFLANIILLFAILPLAVGLTIASYRKGHSRSIVESQGAAAEQGQ